MDIETGHRKRIALIAHDARKDELVNWVTEHRDTLLRHELLATGTTGRLVEEALQTPVHKLLSGPLGGDLQIGALIAEGQVDVLIFFWDPLAAQPHDPDIKALLRVGVLYNIPTASNEATANLILTGLLAVMDG
ncbi:methylglyoxal synthase [Nibrella viscosa]|uniref:Methylglyoxal synthase n=1 Tax=Nibrella viscosa TaxID=1084524 RepID=A0ABP8KWB6_9BACT